MAVDKSKIPKYIRVGTDYFKIIKKPDRFGIMRTELKKWTKDEIKQDHGNSALFDIPKFDDFVIDPSNNGKTTDIHGCYNMYHKFPHEPNQGTWKWTKIMLQHIFGNQYEYGLIYLKILYELPKQALPILVLVSEERETGKSTFLDWLNMLFGANMSMIEPDVIGSNFNGEYATSNIIAIDETILDKQIAVEKIKSLATKKFISVNIKNVAHFKLPFFGKIIMASNNEDKFMRIDEKEIRFWVRKLGTPQIQNHNILNDMVDEIPALLYDLINMPEVDLSRSRMVFTTDEIKNEWLDAVKEESKSGLYKELIELLSEWFQENPNDFCYARPSDIKDKWFNHDSKISRAYIKRVLSAEFKLEQMDRSRFAEFDCLNGTGITSGTPFKLECEAFGVGKLEDPEQAMF